MNQSSIQEIQKASGPLASKCEYQTHYWALVIRATSTDNSILDICIPTVFFNYKQTVSGAHIDFELSDVDDMSEQLEPVHNTIVNELMKAGNLVDQITELFPSLITTKLMSTNLNSMHRHPGSPTSQHFSGTDLSTNHEHNTGIVFPLAEAKDRKPNFAGISAHSAGINKVAHFEYRVAEGKVDPTTDSSITYSKGKCVCYVKDEPKPISNTNAFFLDEHPEQAGYLKLEGLSTISHGAKVIDELFDIWDKSEFLPYTQFVTSENLVEKVYAQVKTGYKVSKTTAADWIEQDEPTRSIEDDVYIKVASAIEWLTQTQADAMPRATMLLKVGELVDFYYDQGESTTMGNYTQLLDDEELIEEYFNLKDYILVELADAVENNAPAKKKEDTELQYQKDVLLSLGSEPKFINTASPTQIKNWYMQVTQQIF